MIYLYYFDGKLKNSPTKMQSESELVERLNKWNYKIDATNGEINCEQRFDKLIAKAQTTAREDYHILTNAVCLIEMAKKNNERALMPIVVSVYDDNSKHWEMRLSALKGENRVNEEKKIVANKMTSQIEPKLYETIFMYLYERDGMVEPDEVKPFTEMVTNIAVDEAIECLSKRG